MSTTLQKHILTLLILTTLSMAQTYPVVDTGQSKIYDDQNEIEAPLGGEAFYGQDAQIPGNQPSYVDNGDGTVTDLVTGLMWQQSADLTGDGHINVDDKLSYFEALAGADTFALAGYSDWRLPTIKESYSLFMFYGEDPSGYSGTDTTGLKPFINTTYFDIAYGDTDAGERLIDGQFASSTIYVGTTMNGDHTMFGVNFVDGRIKGYPTGPMPGSNEDKQYYVLYVRGNEAYGQNDFSDNGDGTVSDQATGFMWEQDDSQTGMNWEEALAYAQTKNSEEHLGYSDWRLPDAKELHSIVDYSRAPSVTSSAAIDPVFEVTSIQNEGDEADYPFYWSSTTHANMQNGAWGAYLCFGEALGFMADPFPPYNTTLLDVHGAGAQRSDPKSGSADDYPEGHGPQGDVVRIDNFVRLVRDIADPTSIEGQSDATLPDNMILKAFPNPFNPTITFQFEVASEAGGGLEIYDLKGNRVATLWEGEFAAGVYQLSWDGTDDVGALKSTGTYLARFQSGGSVQVLRFTMLK